MARDETAPRATYAAPVAVALTGGCVLGCRIQARHARYSTAANPPHSGRKAVAAQHHRARVRRVVQRDRRAVSGAADCRVDRAEGARDAEEARVNWAAR